MGILTNFADILIEEQLRGRIYVRLKVISSSDEVFQNLQQAMNECSQDRLFRKDVDTYVDVDIDSILKRFTTLNSSISSVHNLSSKHTLKHLNKTDSISTVVFDEIIAAVSFLIQVNQVLQSDLAKQEGNFLGDEKESYLDTLEANQHSGQKSIWSRYLFSINHNNEQIFEFIIDEILKKTEINSIKELAGKFYKAVRLIHKATKLLNNVSQSVEVTTIPLHKSVEWAGCKETLQKVLLNAGISDDFVDKLDEFSKMIGTNSLGEIDLVSSTNTQISTIGLMIICSVASTLDQSISLSLERLLSKNLDKSLKLEKVHFDLFKEILNQSTSKGNVYAYCKFQRDVGFLKKAFSEWQESIDSPMTQEISNTGWALIEGKPQLMSFHMFPVGEHMLQVIRALEVLFTVVDFSKDSAPNPRQIKQGFIQKLKNQDPIALSLLNKSRFLFDSYVQNFVDGYLEALMAGTLSEYDDAAEAEYEISRALLGFFDLMPFIRNYDISNKEKVSLILSGLFHDIAKGVQNEKHEMLGADIAEKLIQPLTLSAHETDLILQQIKYHNIVNKMKMYSEDNPVYGLCATMINRPDLLLLISLADRVGSDLKMLNSNVLYKLLENIRQIAAPKGLQREQFLHLPHQIERYIRRTIKAIESENMRELTVRNMKKGVEKFINSMGSLYNLQRAGMPWQLFRDMWRVEKHSTFLAQEGLVFYFQKNIKFQDSDLKGWFKLNEILDKELFESLKTNQFIYKNDSNEWVADIDLAVEKNEKLISMFDNCYGKNKGMYVEFFNDPDETIKKQLVENGYLNRDMTGSEDLNRIMADKQLDVDPVFSSLIKAKLRKKLENGEIHFQPRLLVYGNDYVGLASDLTQFLSQQKIQAESMNFFTGKDGYVIDEVFFNVQDHKRIESFFMEQSREKEFLRVSSDQLRNLYRTEQDFIINKSAERDVDLTYINLEDTQIINIEISQAHDVSSLTNIVLAFRDHQINIEFAHMELIQSVSKDDLISIDKDGSLWKEMLATTSLINPKGEIVINKKSLSIIQEILSYEYPNKLNSYIDLINEKACQNALQLQFIVDTSKGKEVPTALLERITKDFR